MGAEGLKTVSSISSLIFGTAYLVALGLCIAKSRHAWLKTHLLLPVFFHDLLRLTSFVLILLKETGVLFLGADIAYLGLWLPALPIFAMANTAATCVYIAKGPWQVRTSFKACPIWMKVAFILPQVLLVVAMACGTYGVYSPRATDGLTLTVVLISMLVGAVICFWKKHPRAPLWFLLGVQGLLFLACVYRLAVNNYPTSNPLASAFNSGAGSVKAESIVADIFEMAPQCAAALIWVIMPVKQILSMGVFAKEPPYTGPSAAEMLQQWSQSPQHPPPSAVYSQHSMDKQPYPNSPHPSQGGW